MDRFRGASVALQRAAVVGPPEDGAFQVDHVAKTSRPELLGHRGGAVADGAVGDDRAVLGDVDGGRVRAGFDVDGPGEMADVVFRPGAHVQEHGNFAVGVAKPAGQRPGTRGGHPREVVADLPVHQFPGDGPTADGHEQDENDPDAEGEDEHEPPGRKGFSHYGRGHCE